jgi:hypothetical protein
MVQREPGHEDPVHVGRQGATPLVIRAAREVAVAAAQPRSRSGGSPIPGIKVAAAGTPADVRTVLRGGRGRQPGVGGGVLSRTRAGEVPSRRRRTASGAD